MTAKQCPIHLCWTHEMHGECSQCAAVPPSDSGAPPDICATYSPTRDYYLRLRESETPPAPTAFDAEFKKLEAIAARVSVARQQSDACDSEANYARFCKEMCNWERATRPSVLLPLLASLRESLAGVGKDTERLDWLERRRLALNEHYRTSYGWQFVGNHNVNRLFVRDVNTIDLNDSRANAGNIRDAIDAARSSHLATPHPSETAK